MQRKEIDRQEYEDIWAELTDAVETPGLVATIEGRHEEHGAVVLIRQAGRFFVDADNVAKIRAKEVVDIATPGQHDPDQEGGEFF